MTPFGLKSRQLRRQKGVTLQEQAKMSGELFQHMVKKPNACVDIRLASAVNIQSDRYLCFFSFSFNLRIT